MFFVGARMLGVSKVKVKIAKNWRCVNKLSHTADFANINCHTFDVHQYSEQRSYMHVDKGSA